MNAMTLTSIDWKREEIEANWDGKIECFCMIFIRKFDFYEIIDREFSLFIFEWKEIELLDVESLNLKFSAWHFYPLIRFFFFFFFSRKIAFINNLKIIKVFLSLHQSSYISIEPWKMFSIWFSLFLIKNWFPQIIRRHWVFFMERELCEA